MPQREEGSTTQETMKSLAEVLQEMKLANLEELDLFQKWVKKTTEPKENQTIWYFKNHDDRRNGILFGDYLGQSSPRKVVII